MRSEIPWLAVLALAFMACGAESTPPPVQPDGDGLSPGPDTEASSVDPPSGPASGYDPVTLWLGLDQGTAGEVDAVRVGGVLAVDLDPVDERQLRVLVQGHPDPGPAPVTLTAAGKTFDLGVSFSYDPPVDPRFTRIVGFGASLTQGVQRGVPSRHGTLWSPPAQVARHVGGYLPLPLLVDDLFPALAAADIGPPPGCAVPDVEAFVSGKIAEVIPKLSHPETGEFGFQYARLDPDLVVHNVAVGNSTVRDILHGAEATDLGTNFVAHLVYEPYGEFVDPIEESQIERIEALEPTLVMSTDLYGNDVLHPLLGSSLATLSDPEITSIGQDIAVLVGRLADTGAEVFLANLPDPSVLPAAVDKHRLVPDATPEELAAFVDSLAQAAATLNGVLETTASAYENVHVVDLVSLVALIADEGIWAGETELHIGKFGGIVGIDGVHFTDTGYAFLSNVFLEAIDAALGTDVGRIDLGAVVAQDPESPDALRDAGLEVDACE